MQESAGSLQRMAIVEHVSDIGLNILVTLALQSGLMEGKVKSSHSVQWDARIEMSFALLILEAAIISREHKKLG